MVWTKVILNEFIEEALLTDRETEVMQRIVQRRIVGMDKVVAGIIGTIGAAIATAFGGWSEALTTLIIFMAIDYITGIIVAGVFHKSKKSESGSLKSVAGWKGLCKKGVMLLLVLVACRLDILVGTSYIKDAVVIALCVNETISILENVGLMGVPIPKVIRKALDVLQQDENNQTETTEEESE